MLRSSKKLGDVQKNYELGDLMMGNGNGE